MRRFTDMLTHALLTTHDALTLVCKRFYPPPVSKHLVTSTAHTHSLTRTERVVAMFTHPFDRTRLLLETSCAHTFTLDLVANSTTTVVTDTHKKDTYACTQYTYTRAHIRTCIHVVLTHTCLHTHIRTHTLIQHMHTRTLPCTYAGAD